MHIVIKCCTVRIIYDISYLHACYIYIYLLFKQVERQQELLEMLSEPGLVVALSASFLSGLAMACVAAKGFAAVPAALVACLLLPGLLRCFGGFGAWMATWARS